MTKDTGREVHVHPYHVKGGAGSKLRVLTHGVGERGCHSWNKISFQHYVFFPVYLQRDSGAFYVLLGINVRRKQKVFLIFLAEVGDKLSVLNDTSF